jgi:hypothetical protein
MADVTNEDVVRRAYEAFNTGDMAALTELFDADTVWHVPGNNALSGTYDGRDATFGMFGKLGELTEGTYRPEAQKLETDGDVVVAHNHVIGKRGGSTLDATSVIRFRLANGRIVEAKEIPDDQAAWDEFMA